MRVCIVYDCLYPYTVGGAERWYRSLAERVAARGHDVTYLTRRQWEVGDTPSLRDVHIVDVSSGGELYTRDGRRRVQPPLTFGAGVLRHLLRDRYRYDIVHTASFPYFSVLAAAAARRRGGFRLFVDWHEVWTRDYWHAYLGPAGGRAGWEIQRACLRVSHQAFCFSRMHEQRLRESGLSDVTRLDGQYAGGLELATAQRAELVVVFAGRLIPEKNAAALLPAVVQARERVRELRLEIYGDGPERARILHSIDQGGLRTVVSAPGFVAQETLEHALARAMCLMLPSRREGYGLVVIEAAAKGIPSVVVRGPDNAAVELIEDGVNGVVAPSAAPHDLAAAILRVHEGGVALRRSTADWFTQNARRLSLESSLERILDEYANA